MRWNALIFTAPPKYGAPRNGVNPPLATWLPRRSRLWEDRRMPRERRLHTSHWGAFEVEAEGETVVAVHPYPDDPDPSPLLGNIAGSVHHRARIAQPMVRA